MGVEVAATLRSQIGIMSVDEVAAVMDVTPHTLYVWRADGKGPKFVKLGRSVFYRRQDVQDWIDANVVQKESA